MKRFVTILFLSAFLSSCVPTQQKEDARDFIKRKGPPQYTASSLEDSDHLLVCHGLKSFEADDAKAADMGRGRVLVYCEPWVELCLSTASLDLKMKHAAPLIGYEGPNMKFTDAPIPQKNESSRLPLTKPERVLAVYIDERGQVSRSVNITFQQVQCMD